MADIVSLRLFGFILGGITLAVTLVAFLVVRANVQGRPQVFETKVSWLLPSAQPLI
jgi:hypothetical protein